MKTHTSRWTREGASWVLQARAQDGGEELGRVTVQGPLLYKWEAAQLCGAADGLSAAQRAVRKVLRGT